MTHLEVCDILREKGFTIIEYWGKWKGYDVYAAFFEEDSIMNLPLVLVKGNKIKHSTEKQAGEISHFLHPEWYD